MIMYDMRYKNTYATCSGYFEDSLYIVAIVYKADFIYYEVYHSLVIHILCYLRDIRTCQ
jgi:hypothetical protein